MSRIPDPRRSVGRDISPPASFDAFRYSFRLLGLAAAALLTLSAATSARAQALSLINPAAAATAKVAAEALTTEVRGGHGGGHGGGYGGGRVGVVAASAAARPFKAVRSAPAQRSPAVASAPPASALAVIGSAIGTTGGSSSAATTTIIRTTMIPITLIRAAASS